MKKLISLFLCLCLALTGIAAIAEVAVGEPVADFAVTAIDGSTITNADLLASYDMIYVDFFYADCQWCEREFPVLLQAWQPYADQVALLALDPFDSMEDIAAYAGTMGLNCYVASDDDMRLSNAYGVTTYPTGMIIDRNGVVCWMRSGAILNPATFEAMFEDFTTDDYSDPLTDYTTPDVGYRYPEQDPEVLKAASGGDKAISWVSGGSDYYVPFTPDGEKEQLVFEAEDGEDITAVLQGVFMAKAGDSVTFTAGYERGPESIPENGGFYAYLVNSDEITIDTAEITGSGDTYTLDIPSGGVMMIGIVCTSAGAGMKVYVKNVKLVSK